MPSRLLNSLAAAALGAALFVSSTPANAEPALWQIKNGETTVYLFGSVHVLPSDVSWRSATVDKAIKSANVFVWEAPGSISSMEKGHRFIMDSGILPRGKTLSKMLSPAGLKDYKEILKRTGAEPELVNVSHPWRAWFMLETGGLRPAPGESSEDFGDVSLFHGVDLLLQQEADKNNAKEKGTSEKRYLETAAGQLSYFEKALPDDHVADFEKHLHKLLTDKSKFKTVVAEWSRGNVGYIARMNAEDEKEFRLDQQMILHERNKNWIPQIEGMLTEKKTFFITVGAAHLAGSGSVIELLCGKGWKVQRVNGGASAGPACAAMTTTKTKPQEMARQVALRP